MTKRKRKTQKNKIVHVSDSESSLAERVSNTTDFEQQIKQVLSQSHFAGPIPHPEIFKLYGEIIPDAPERILSVFEKDSQAARDLPIKAIEAQKEDNRRAHWMAWSLVMSAFGLSVVFAMMDKDWLSGITLGTTLVGIVTGFLQSNKPDVQNLSVDKPVNSDN
jgi:uncharacterized membrane protein